MYHGFDNNNYSSDVGMREMALDIAAIAGTKCIWHTGTGEIWTELVEWRQQIKCIEVNILARKAKQCDSLGWVLV